MNSTVNKYLQLLKRHIWAVAAFFVPLSIRSIPEILSWPYLLGLDTLTVVNIIQSGHVVSNPLNIFRNQLFYSVATIANPLVGNSLILLKILGPILMGSVALMMYLFSKHGLGWSGFKSFLVALLVGTYFVTLRNSWDLYSQSFALIFLLATLISFKSFDSRWRYPVVLFFTILTVLSHELVSVLLLFILFLESLRFLIKKSQADFVYSLVIVVLGVAILLWRHYIPSLGEVFLPSTGSAGVVASFARTQHMFGLILYCFGLLLPFVILGLKSFRDRMLGSWALLCISFIIISMILPDNPFYYWNRWVYLLVYPLLFFAVAGLDALWQFGSKLTSAIKPWLPKIVAVSYVAMLLVLSGFYVAASPDRQLSFFAADNPYLTYIPSSMLQNTLPIKENPSFIACSNWINDNAPKNSIIVEHYALYDLTTIYVHNLKVVNVHAPSSIWVAIQNETSLVDGMISTSELALANGNSTVYTIWWIKGEGWYKIPSLPPCFEEVYQIDNLAVYSFEPYS